jgi:hypothetical protein
LLASSAGARGRTIMLAFFSRQRRSRKSNDMARAESPRPLKLFKVRPVCGRCVLVITKPLYATEAIRDENKVGTKERTGQA